MRKILLVEDDKDIQEVNKKMLERRGGYDVCLAMNLAEAREMIPEFNPDIILLDVMLPDGNGLDFLKELRQDKDIPVLLLTALFESDDVVRGLRAGGDDYLAKPYENKVLLARIESLIRRMERMPETLTKGSLVLDLYSNRAFSNGEDLLLTEREFALLRLLAQNEGRTVGAEYIYEKVWGLAMNDDNRTLKRHISAIRSKLEASGCTIQNARGKGYCFSQTDTD